MKLSQEQIAFLIKLAGGTEDMVSRNHPQHHACIQQAVENAFTLFEAAQEYEAELDNERFNKVWENLA